ncbi:hypothetical protein [Ciceribacter sp. L1K22]|uniref:hypothetical protein n=1 Tax=Ciceribacter sp. L1K22 TaxID=2820275 RepID=UPI001ABE7C1D|nr:hypothetical protein [Ciceribacter sp. L1K22]MBO3760347.1 hypothetical protein [Ciceribacter sp. L1K22]
MSENEIGVEAEVPAIVLPTFRNAQYNKHGTIDVEVQHPTLGWIPSTAVPDDASPICVALYNAALAAGPAPYVPPTPEELRAVMPGVTARQIRLTLVRNGFSLGAIDAAIDALPEGQAKDEARIEWEYATLFERLSPTLLTIAAALSISAEQVDTMWAEAVAS